jgi:hypothetical protein
MNFDWKYFKNSAPRNKSKILVEDHEGNIGIGIYRSGAFENLSGFPIGFPLKWMKLIIIVEKENGEYTAARAFTMDMEPIDVYSFYDFNDPI